MTIKLKFDIGKILTIYIPILCSILTLLHTIFDFYSIESRIFSYLSGTSVLIWLYFLWNSYLYSLCLYQKMFVYYLIFSNSISMYDYYIGIPVNNLKYLFIYVISFGMSILFYGYLKLKENK